MKIVGYLQTSLLEWPGKISAVIFAPGCNLRCPFCHNKDLVLDFKKLPLISEEEILCDLEKRRKWVDGVVVTGGEPTLQVNLEVFLEKIKSVGILTMIETNGTKPEVLKKLLCAELLNYVAIDVKGPLDERYEEFVGVKVDVNNVKKSIQNLHKSEIDYELRTTVVPTLHTKELLVGLAKQLRGILNSPRFARSGRAFATFNCPPWYLQQFMPQNCLNADFIKIKPYSEKELNNILEKVKGILPNTALRGI